MFERPSRRSRTGRRTLREVRKWSGDNSKGSEVVGHPYGGLEVVGGHSWRSESGRGTIPLGWKWSGDAPKGT